MNSRTEIRVPCTNCRNPTTHGILRDVEIDEYDQYSGIRVWDGYFIAQCLGCKAVSFVHESTCSENYEANPLTGNDKLVVKTTLYPSRLQGRQPIHRADFVPEMVLRIYTETFRAMGEKMPILAGIGIRAIIETVGNEKHASGGNLEKRIDSLVQLGLITSDGAMILHSLRFLGNAAAHETKAHSDEELEAALDVVEHLLNSVYILPKLAAKLPARTR